MDTYWLSEPKTLWYAFLWGLDSDKWKVSVKLPRSGSSTDTLQKCHIWQLCPSDIGLTKKNWSKIFWSKTLSKIRLLQIFLFLREKSKSGQVRFFFSQREIENLDTSRFFIFKVKIKSGHVQIFISQCKILDLDLVTCNWL